ncbi:hypothetical protein HUG10_14040 [Halorarum halophilum]|uniref:Uncharacterized protein n=1 Tax=Halorarum halophilum TaxID=2743090 RepID=A0A7D5KEY5_9EURY|nr:hypothetical protein [Halobaculum halophilum]QLG28597.1 hypothetical protein HUG10_14040 [Halobaculum halophilum]
MAAKRPTVGLDHPTVVPANFDPDGRGAGEADAGDEGTDGGDQDEDAEATDDD